MSSPVESPPVRDEAPAREESDVEETSHDDEDAQNEEGTVIATSNNLVIKAVPNLNQLFGLRELGRDALCWQLSSAKPGNGVDQIKDQCFETYWQSDGNSQPHWIQIHFARRVAISHVCLYAEYQLDESYSPKTLEVIYGMSTQDLIPAIYPAKTKIELLEPNGWCIIPLSSAPDPLDEVDDDEASIPLVRAHVIRISILSMHQNGRDTHVRQVQLYGPRNSRQPNKTHWMPTGPEESLNRGVQSTDESLPMVDPTTVPPDARYGMNDFRTVGLSQYSTIR